MARLMEHNRKSKCRPKSGVYNVCVIMYDIVYFIVPKCHWLKDTILCTSKKEKNDFNWQEFD